MPAPNWLQATGSAIDGSPWPNIKGKFLHDSLTGNGGIVLIEYSGTHTFTVADNKTNTWTEVSGAAETTGAQCLRVFYCQTMTAGTRSITVTPNSDATYMRAIFIEVCGVSTVNTSNSSDGTSASASTNITTTVTGCMIFHFVTQGTSDGYFSSTQIVSASGGEVVLSSTWDGNLCQQLIQAGSGSITPAVTYPSSIAWTSSVIALTPSAGAGTALPTTPRFRRRMFYSGLASQSILPNMAADVTTVKLDFPRSDGSCIVYSAHAWNLNNSDHSVTSIVDQGNNNFFQAVVTSQFVSGQRADLSIWYAPNASSTTPFDTITYANLVTEITFACYELVNLPNATKGATYTGTGTDSGADPFTAGVITPTQVNSLIVVNMPIELSTVISSTGPTADAFDGFWATGMSGGFNRMEEDNGHGHHVSPDLTQQTWTWSSTSGNVNNWGIVMAEFIQGTAVTRNSPAFIPKALPMQQRTIH